MTKPDSFGGRLGKLMLRVRGDLGVSQERLADQVFGDRSRKTDISKIENGRVPRPQAKTVAAIAAALGLDDTEIDALRSADDRAIEGTVERLIAENADLSQRLHLRDTLVAALAYEYAGASPGDFPAMIRGLRNALETAAAMRARSELPQNTGDQVQAVLRRMAELNDRGEVEAAAGEVDRALAALDEEEAQVRARKAALLDAGVDQDVLRRNPASAAARLVAKLRLEVGGEGLFEALRALKREWHERGRDLGLNFDAEVAVELAKASVETALSADQRGSGLNDLGVALQTIGIRDNGAARLEESIAIFRAALVVWSRERVPLDWALVQNNLGISHFALGERDHSTTRLKEAVAAFRSALHERTRERVPLDWAMTQNNLGTALWALGERESGNTQLEDAVVAIRAALEVRTRERVPLDWSATQNNLGNALQTLGEREIGTASLWGAIIAYRAALEVSTRERLPLSWATTQNNLATALRLLGAREGNVLWLKEAVAAYRAALEEYTRERVPLDWATAQNNLGIAFAAIGRREPGTAWLKEAVAAYHAALEEWTRDRVPLDWAGTQNNLANVEVAFFDKTGEAGHLDAAEAYLAAAREVFGEAGATQYLAKADTVAAMIAERRRKV